MKRFIIILTIIGLTFLLSAAALHWLPINPHRLARIMTSDGSFDPLAEYAFQGLALGLALAALFLLILAGFFFLVEKRSLGFATGKTRVFLALIIGAQLVLSIIYISIVEYKPDGDAFWYHTQAANLAAGKGVVDDQGRPTAYWPVGYPFLLAPFYFIFGPQAKVAAALNLLFLGGMTLMTYLIGRTLLNEKTARAGSLIMALFPSQIFYALPPMCDTPFAFFTMVMVYLILQKSSRTNTLLIGLCYGVCLYLRPVIIFYPVIFILYRLLRDKSWRPVFRQVVFIGLIGEALLLPWQIRNYRAFDQFVFAATYGGYNLWLGNNPVARYGGWVQPWEVFPQDTVTWLNRDLSEVERDRFYLRRGLDYIRSHPVRAISYWPLKLIHLYLKDSKCLTYGLAFSYAQFIPPAIMAMLLVTEGVYYSLGLAFLLGLIPFLKGDIKISSKWIFLGTILYFSLIYLPFVGEGRYHQLLLPLFALVVSYPALKSKS